MKINPRAMLAALLMAPMLAACGTATDTQPNELTCVRNGGPFDNTNFREWLPPGSGRERVGQFSSTTEIPIDARSYTISKDPAKGDMPVADQIRVSLGGITMDFQPVLYFHFNNGFVESGGQTMPMGCEWDITQGSKLGATDFNTVGGKWQTAYLPQNFRPAVNDTFISVAQSMMRSDANTPFALWSNTPITIDGEEVLARDYLASEVGRLLPTKFESLYGHPYFCGAYVPPAEDGSLFKVEQCEPINVVISEQPDGITPQSVVESWVTAQSAQNTRLAAEAAARETATQEKNLAAIAADQAEQVAAANKRKAEADALAAVATAQAQANQADALAAARAQTAAAEAQVAQAELTRKQIEAQVEMAKCTAVQALGSDCALLTAALNGQYPQVVMGDGSVQVAR